MAAVSTALLIETGLIVFKGLGQLIKEFKATGKVPLEINLDDEHVTTTAEQFLEELKKE